LSGIGKPVHQLLADAVPAPGFPDKEVADDDHAFERIRPEAGVVDGITDGLVIGFRNEGSEERSFSETGVSSFIAARFTSKTGSLPSMVARKV